MDWLNKELDRIGWADSELARRCKVTPAAIYRITKDGMTPSAKLARAIADALKPFTGISQETVFKLAGLIDGDKDGIDPRMVSIFTQGWNGLPPDVRGEAEEYVSTHPVKEVVEFLIDLIKREFLHSEDASADGEGVSDEERPSHSPPKGAKHNKARLLQRAKGAS